MAGDYIATIFTINGIQYLISRNPEPSLIRNILKLADQQRLDKKNVHLAKEILESDKSYTFAKGDSRTTLFDNEVTAISKRLDDIPPDVDRWLALLVGNELFIVLRRNPMKSADLVIVSYTDQEFTGNTYSVCVAVLTPCVDRAAASLTMKPSACVRTSIAAVRTSDGNFPVLSPEKIFFVHPGEETLCRQSVV